MAISLTQSAFWTAFSTAVKLLVGLALIKLIAISFGADGLGQAANYMTLLTVLSVLSGAGLLNGITKFVAEYAEQPQKLATLLGTSSLIILIFSLFLTALGWFLAEPISIFLFQTSGFENIIRYTAILQLGIAISYYFLAVIKGQRDAKGYALVNIGGILLGAMSFLLLLWQFDYSGALIGLALMPVWTYLPAYVRLKMYATQKCGVKSTSFFHFSLLKPKWDHQSAQKLSQFSLMTFATACTIPVIYILLRNQLAQLENMQQVGLWQAMGKISDAYLQLITAAFSVYLLPTFAKLHSSVALKKEVGKALSFVFPVAFLLSAFIYLWQDTVILWLFNAEFLAMKPLFLWQLIGDIFKVASYVFGYLWLAKARVKRYIMAELLQALLLWGMSSFLIQQSGAVGAVQGYMWCYIVYFFACLSAFFYDQKRMQ
ncbi:hypothetical protein A4G18_09050 [Pasteurellaceae bacterium Pebbles2]|nr:hypothetical protein [Pasteurellaceae bacterium Pebbles2]